MSGKISFGELSSATKFSEWHIYAEHMDFIIELFKFITGEKNTSQEWEHKISSIFFRWGGERNKIIIKCAKIVNMSSILKIE